MTVIYTKDIYNNMNNDKLYDGDLTLSNDPLVMEFTDFSLIDLIEKKPTIVNFSRKERFDERKKTVC